MHELPVLLEKYNLEFCANQHLLEEFTIVIERERIKKYLLQKTAYYKEVMSRFVSLHNTRIKYNGSPDPNDDYLVDVVRQVNSVGLVVCAIKKLFKNDFLHFVIAFFRPQIAQTNAG